MICPKCKKQIDENATVCPYCKKVLALICPRCGNICESNTCNNCGFVILSKCKKCKTLNQTVDKYCRKCGESTYISAAKRFTDNETFSALTITFANVSKLGNILESKKLLSKFLFKLKSMIFEFAKNIHVYCLMINDSTFVLNFTDYGTGYINAQKAMKSGIKILNIISNLNRTLKKELLFTLEVRLAVEEKDLNSFFDLTQNSEKIKLLDLYTEQNNAAKGIQFIVDQYIYKFMRKEYNLESLYTTTRNNEVISYYILNPEKYIIPVTVADDTENKIDTATVKIVTKKETDYEQELYKKSLEGIKVNCKFEQMGAEKIYEYLKKQNFTSGNKIISLRGNPDRQLPTKTVIDILSQDIPCYTVICANEIALNPWAFFKDLAEEIFANNLNKFTLGQQHDKLIASIRNLNPPVFETAENARLAYIELFITLLTSIPRAVIYIENFEYIDSASLRVLEEVFSKITQTKLSFVITNNRGYALQKVIPELLNSFYYTEIFTGQMDTPVAIQQILDSDDFKKSFYYKKIIDNAGSSYQYCVNAINYLRDSGIIVNFNDKLVVTESKTVIFPFGLEHLINTRLKKLSKDSVKSLILAYSYILGPVISIENLGKLGLNTTESIQGLEDSGFITSKNGKIYIQNYEVLKNSFKTTLKPEVLKYLASNLLNKVLTGSTREYATVTSLDLIESFSIEFSKLYEHSIITLQFGDYDTYLKTCIRLLKLLKTLGKDISEDEIREYQTDFYNNLTQLLYRYAPERIYPIAESLLQRAVEQNDSEKIVTLSNMMLQGGLLTSNYTNALTLIQNILERTANCSLTDKNGTISYKVFSLYLVSVEIYFYIGDYDKCITVSRDILAVLTPAKLTELKPPSFSPEQFKLHVLNSFIYSLFSNILIGNCNIEDELEKIRTAVGNIPEGTSDLVAICRYIQDKRSDDTIPQIYANRNSELISPLINAIINFNGDYSLFAANIYEFKKIAASQSKTPCILLGDLLIGYSYKQLNSFGKAEHIYMSVYTKAKSLSLFFIIHLANYFIADLYVNQKKYQEALQAITNSITVIERSSKPCSLLLYLFKKKLIEISQIQGYTNIDITQERGFISQFEHKHPLFERLQHV